MQLNASQSQFFTDQCIQAPYWLSSTSRVLETGWPAGSGMISEQGTPQIRQNQTSHTVASLVKKTSPARIPCSAQFSLQLVSWLALRNPFQIFQRRFSCPTRFCGTAFANQASTLLILSTCEGTSTCIVLQK